MKNKIILLKKNLLPQVKKSDPIHPNPLTHNFSVCLSFRESQLNLSSSANLLFFSNG